MTPVYPWCVEDGVIEIDELVFEQLDLDDILLLNYYAFERLWFDFFLPSGLCSLDPFIDPDNLIFGARVVLK